MNEKNHSAEIGRTLIAASIVIDKTVDVPNAYPVVAPIEALLTVAMMGMKKGRIDYVGNDGKCLTTYMPSHIRHYSMM